MRKTALFPASVWDGITTWRPALDITRSPDPEDWDELLAEIMAVETALYPSQADDVLWVAPHGVAATATGTITNPYATLTAALAAVTADNTTICMLPGTYSNLNPTTIPGIYTGLKIIGVGGSSVTTFAHTANGGMALSCVPGTSSAFELTIEGLTINQLATKIGISFSDATSTAALTLNLKDVNIIMDTSGDSLDIIHTTAYGLILNLEECVFTGLMDIDIIDAADRVNAERCDFSAAGVTLSAGAVAGLSTFRYCILKAANSMTSAAQQTITSVFSVDEANTLVATTELSGGTATEVIVGL